MQDFDRLAREPSPYLLQGSTPLTILPPNCSQALTTQLESTVQLPPDAASAEAAPSASGAMRGFAAAGAAVAFAAGVAVAM